MCPWQSGYPCGTAQLERCNHMNCLELLAGVFDLKRFHHKGIHALARTDNTTVLCSNCLTLLLWCNAHFSVSQRNTRSRSLAPGPTPSILRQFSSERMDAAPICGGTDMELFGLRWICMAPGQTPIAPFFPLTDFSIPLGWMRWHICGPTHCCMYLSQ